MEQIVKPEHAPDYQVWAEGRDITATLRNSLASLVLTDNGGATAKADELKITLLSETLALPSKGARLRLALGFNNQLVEKGWFVVSTVGSSGPPRRVEISASAAPVNAQKQPGNVTSQKTRSWDNLRLADLVTTVAAENGLKAKISAGLADIHIDHIDQVAESDANLLARLARTWNAVSKPAGGYWLFLKQGEVKSVSGKQRDAVIITPADVTNWSYSEGERGSSSGKASGPEGKETAKISVRYYDEADGRTKTAAVDHQGPALTNPYTQPAKETAEQQAKSRKTQANRNEQKLTLSGPCRTEHLLLSAESAVITTGFGTREDRAWNIESLVFSLTSAGLSYSCNLVVDTRKPTHSSTHSVNAQGPDYFG